MPKINPEFNLQFNLKQAMFLNDYYTVSVSRTVTLDSKLSFLMLHG